MRIWILYQDLRKQTYKNKCIIFNLSQDYPKQYSDERLSKKKCIRTEDRRFGAQKTILRFHYTHLDGRIWTSRFSGLTTTPHESQIPSSPVEKASFFRLSATPSLCLFSLSSNNLSLGLPVRQTDCTTPLFGRSRGRSCLTQIAPCLTGLYLRGMNLSTRRGKSSTFSLLEQVVA